MSLGLVKLHETGFSHTYQIDSILCVLTMTLKHTNISLVVPKLTSNILHQQFPTQNLLSGNRLRHVYKRSFFCVLPQAAYVICIIRKLSLWQCVCSPCSSQKQHWLHHLTHPAAYRATPVMSYMLSINTGINIFLVGSVCMSKTGIAGIIITPVLYVAF